LRIGGVRHASGISRREQNQERSLEQGGNRQNAKPSGQALDHLGRLEAICGFGMATVPIVSAGGRKKQLQPAHPGGRFDVIDISANGGDRSPGRVPIKHHHRLVILPTASL
jgi:hypothetical protein